MGHLVVRASSYHCIQKVLVCILAEFQPEFSAYITTTSIYCCIIHKHFTVGALVAVLHNAQGNTLKPTTQEEIEGFPNFCSYIDPPALYEDLTRGPLAV